MFRIECHLLAAATALALVTLGPPSNRGAAFQSVDAPAVAQGVTVRVVDQYASPIPFAQVWINGRQPLTVDTLGELRLAQALDPNARVMVRRIGFAARTLPSRTAPATMSS